MEIYILDKELNIIDVVPTYESMVWNTKTHEPGTFKIKFIFSKRMSEKLVRGNLIYITGEEEPGIIVHVTKELSKTGEETITVQGFMASRYLAQRIVWSKMILSGTPERVMRQMVYEQVVAPVKPERKMSCIELGEEKGIDLPEIKKQITYDNLQTALTDVAKAAELGYRLRIDLAEKKLLFDVFQGKNRTEGQEEQCVITRQLGNIITQKFDEDWTNYKNVCLVGGPGEDQDRVLVNVGEGEGLDRYEMFYNASGISGDGITQSELEEQLEQKGNEKLASYYVAQGFESKIDEARTKNLALGDYVTCMDKDWGIKINTQVKAISRGFSKKEKSFVVTFGDDCPTLMQLIKAQQ